MWMCVDVCVYTGVKVYTVTYASEGMHGSAQVYLGVVQVCMRVNICTCPYRAVGSGNVQVCSVPEAAFFIVILH